MPSYKLTYFDLTALGEPIRMLLAYGGIEFEDNRIEDDKWPDMKESKSRSKVQGHNRTNLSNFIF